MTAAAGAVAEPRATIDYEVIARDLQKMPSDQALTTRYVSLSEVDVDDLDEAQRVVTYMLNSVAALRSGAIAHPSFLAGGRIVRFQAEWLAPEPSDLESFLITWERFAERNPYTCFETEVLVDGELRTVPVVGGWVDEKLAQFISQRTGSISPVLHFGHFLKSLDGDGYYELSGIGSRDETLAELGVNLKLVTELHADRAATVKRSKVANAKPRRIRVFQGVFGSAWITYDTDAISAKNDAVRQPLSNINVEGDQGTSVSYDANEYVITGRNGLPVFLITAADGSRQAVVRPEIARDYSELHDRYDGQIRAPYSCIRCHSRSGYNEFEDYQQTLAERGQFAYEAEDAIRIAETYRADLVQRRLDFDQLIIETSTEAVTGWEWDELSMQVAMLYRKYVLDDITPAEASRVLQADVATTVGQVTTDPYLLALAAGESISRDAWYASVHLAFLNGVVDENYHHISTRFDRHDGTSGGSAVPAATGAADQQQSDSGEGAGGGASGDPSGGLRLGGLPDLVEPAAG